MALTLLCSSISPLFRVPEERYFVGLFKNKFPKGDATYQMCCDGVMKIEMGMARNLLYIGTSGEVVVL